MSRNKPTSFRLAPVDREDLEYLVRKGVFTNPSDAARAALRKGIEQIKRERGINGANE